VGVSCFILVCVGFFSVAFLFLLDFFNLGVESSVVPLSIVRFSCEFHVSRAGGSLSREEGVFFRFLDEDSEKYLWM
jgi:hypothetical protein